VSRRTSWYLLGQSYAITSIWSMSPYIRHRHPASVVSFVSAPLLLQSKQVGTAISAFSRPHLLLYHRAQDRIISFYRI
jgi:hypothetical protein